MFCNAKCLLTLLMVCLGTHSAQAVSVGQVDDFQDGTTQGWLSPNPVANLADVGPAGIGDDVLQLISDGSPGSQLVTFNNSQWLGNYSTAGVNSIVFDANNLGPSNVSLGFSINGSAFTFDTGTIPSGSGWNTYEIPFDTLLFGSSTNLDNVTNLELRHMAGGSFLGGVPLEVHIDNIRAVPEPASIAIVVIGGLMLLAMCKKSCGRNLKSA